jgi:hypothetical protein
MNVRPAGARGELSARRAKPARLAACRSQGAPDEIIGGDAAGPGGWQIGASAEPEVGDLFDLRLEIAT